MVSLRDPARAQAIADEYGVTLESAERRSTRELLANGLRTQTLVLWASWLLLALRILWYLPLAANYAGQERLQHSEGLRVLPGHGCD